MHPDSKLFGLGGQRSNLPLMDSQGHPVLGGSQSGVGISHHNTLPMMHPSMKSPLTPPGGPLELTVSSHQRTTMGADARKFSLGKFLWDEGQREYLKILGVTSIPAFMELTFNFTARFYGISQFN